MTKKIWMTLGAMSVAIVLGLGVYHANASQAEPTLSFDDIRELVMSQYPGTITELELDKDVNGTIYEVEIMNDGIEYEVKIDGNSGEIIKLKEKRIAAKERASTKEIIDLKEKEQEQAKLKKEKEEKAAKEQAEKEAAEKERAQQEKREQEKQQQQQQAETKIAKNDSQDIQDNQSKQQKPKKEKQKKKAVIDKNQAIDIALAQFPGVVEDVELDDEDGRLIYEIEIEGNGEEAEFEIDAYTGEIIVIEIDD